MPVDQKLSALTLATTPLDDTDEFYVIQQTTSTTTTFNRVTFIDLSNQINPGGGSGVTLQVNGVNNASQTLLNFQDTGSVTWANPSGGVVQATSTGGGGGGALTLIQNQILTVNSTTITFSGLDGNTDGVYILEGRLSLSNNTQTVTWQPNSITTNQQSMRDISGFTANYSNLILIDASAGGNFAAVFSIKIWAKCDPNSQAFQRFYTGTIAYLDSGGTHLTGTIGGQWNETSTNITSIVVTTTQANGLLNGSNVALYKVSQ